MPNWPVLVLRGAALVVVLALLADFVGAILSTHQLPRRITPRRASELKWELWMLVRAGAMSGDAALLTWQRELGSWRISIFFPETPIMSFFEAECAYHRQRWDETFPEYKEINPWRDT